MESPVWRGTTILGVRRDGRLALAGDGQVSMNQTVIKSRAKKIRRLHDGKVLVGFAGATADAMTLFEKLEAKLKDYNGNLPRSAVELAKDWRSDRALRRLDAMLIAGDAGSLLVITGSGDVLEPDDSIAAVGSGGGYALAAARALAGHTTMDAAQIAEASLKIASSICIYTNEHIIVETL
ncbi:MAG: ATP-dependent protease subunit ClpQ [candidate division BRC1 bacterium ADurb.BinA364]|nr:MAG: ATP-dependent protease subunit ClpQ [candidate division BRC1 bacterium ADurb.BinA364]